MTPDRIAALLHVLGVLALAALIIAVFFGVFLLLALLVDGRKLRRELRRAHLRRVEDYERKKLMGEPWPPKDIKPFQDEDEETKTWPGPGATI